MVYFSFFRDSFFTVGSLTLNRLVGGLFEKRHGIIFSIVFRAVRQWLACLFFLMRGLSHFCRIDFFALIVLELEKKNFEG